MVAVSGLSDNLLRIWGIEKIADLPDDHRQGLIDRLFDHVFHEGR